MRLENIRDCDAFDGETPRAEFVFENGSRELFVKDVAWGVACVLRGAGSKLHAGCFFTDSGDGVVVNAGECGGELSYEEARDFVDEHRPGALE